MSDSWKALNRVKEKKWTTIKLPGAPPPNPQAVFDTLLAELQNPATEKTHWEVERQKAIALMELPSFFLNGELQGERGRSYKVLDLERFILHAAMVLAEIEHFRELTIEQIRGSFQDIENRLISLIHDSCECGIKPKKEGKELSGILPAWREKMLATVPPELDRGNLYDAAETLTIYFSSEIPDAPANLIAKHVRRALENLAGIPEHDLPSPRAITGWVAKQRSLEKKQA
jgi:hypothetical protein